MAHISSLTAVKYTRLDYSDPGAGNTFDRPGNAAMWRALFESANGTLVAAEIQGTDSEVPTTDYIGNVREFPSLGTPANIVNVPVYGQSTSSQVGGQADAPTLEFTLNYTPTDHAALEALRTASREVAWRVRLTDAEAVGGNIAGLTTVQRNTYADSDELYDDFYFLGTIQSFEVTPSLSDSMQATFSVSINGDFEGPYSETPGGTYGLPA